MKGSIAPKPHDGHCGVTLVSHPWPAPYPSCVLGLITHVEGFDDVPGLSLGTKADSARYWAVVLTQRGLYRSIWPIICVLGFPSLLLLAVSGFAAVIFVLSADNIVEVVNDV